LQELARALFGKSALYGAYDAAITLVMLGDKDKAFAELNRAYENREPHMVYLKVAPRLDPLRDDRRFKELLTRVGFPQ
jgi:adenylate cyclase